MAKRQTFFSFHFKNDVWRASQVRNMGVIGGNTPVSDNDWETIKKKGDNNIKRWIDSQLALRSCVVVLVGSQTASRKWVKYEIKRGWELGKGILGIRIHKLKDSNQKQSSRGNNPFSVFNVNKVPLSKIVKLYEPPFTSSAYVYNNIKNNIGTWVEEAIIIRDQYN